MKILHALVGYLAVISLPFHPFAFASPLAIDYDGFVNNTQKNIDGALKHGDSALMKHVPGDIIEARQIIYIPYFLAVVAVISGVLLGVAWIEDNDSKREAFTQSSISNIIAKYPNFNWVICHSPYSIAFDGVDGTDYGYTHHELKVAFGRTIGYDLYWAKSGTFNRYGDGGLINWAYNGNILGTDNGGATVHFGVQP